MADEPANPDPQQQNESLDDFLGYRSLEALKQAHLSSGSHAKQLAAENQALKQQMAAAVNPLPGGMQRQDPRSELNSWGLPVESLDAYLDQRITQAFAPIAEGLNARSKVLSEYPDWGKHEADVYQYVNSDPQLSQEYADIARVNPAAAMKYALRAYSDSKRRGHSGGNGATREVIANETAQAQIPTNRPGETRQQGQGQDRAPVRAAFDHWQKTGDPVPFSKARLREIIPDSFFQQGGGT